MDNLLGVSLMCRHALSTAQTSARNFCQWRALAFAATEEAPASREEVRAPLKRTGERVTSDPARSAIAPLGGGMLSRTLAYGTDSRNIYLIFPAIFLACVINGETLTGILAQATWLTVAVIVLVIVQVIDRLSVERSPRRARPIIR
ncbi:hypothetical protein [Streptomyces sp. NPDC052811]|uniref:hypothetical protein n=1 Tax=Streptomyces sp. NPDC052811 TaxID=3155731 RepID=UPI003413F75A